MARDLMKIYLIAFATAIVIIIGGFLISAEGATILQPYQGGTGFSTTTAGNVGNFLQVQSVNPLTYTFAAGGDGGVSGGAATTTINDYQSAFFTIQGTAGQIDVTNDNGTSTWSFANPLTFPGDFTQENTINLNSSGWICADTNCYAGLGEYSDGSLGLDTSSTLYIYNSNTGGNSLNLDISQIQGGDRTQTFQNKSGIISLQEDNISLFTNDVGYTSSTGPNLVYYFYRSAENTSPNYASSSLLRIKDIERSFNDNGIWGAGCNSTTCQSRSPVVADFITDIGEPNAPYLNGTVKIHLKSELFGNGQTQFYAQVFEHTLSGVDNLICTTDNTPNQISYSVQESDLSCNTGFFSLTSDDRILVRVNYTVYPGLNVALSISMKADGSTRVELPVPYIFQPNIIQINTLSTSTGNLIVASSTGWQSLGIGTNKKVLMASSTASLGVSWETVALQGDNLSLFTNDVGFVTSTTGGGSVAFPIPYASTTGVQDTLTFPLAAASTTDNTSFPIDLASTTGIQATLTFPLAAASTTDNTSFPIPLASTTGIQGTLTFPIAIASTTAQPYYWTNSGNYLSPTSTAWMVNLGNFTTSTSPLGFFFASTTQSGYAEANFVNMGTSATSSMSIVIGNSSTTALNYYGEFGINGATYSDPAYPAGLPHDVFISVSGGNLTLITSSTNTATTTGNIKFFTSTQATTSEAMRITTAGYVGIGTTTPQGIFQVATSSSATSFLVVSSTTGYVGIGTSTPKTTLYVYGSSTVTDVASSTNLFTTVATTTNLTFTSGTSTTALGIQKQIIYPGSATTSVNRNAELMTGTIFTQTADKGISSTTSQTSLIGAGIGTSTIASSSLIIGKSLSYEQYGRFNTTTTAPLFNLATYLNSTLITTSTTLMTASMLNTPYYLWGNITARTTGGTGTVYSQHFLQFGSVATSSVNITTVTASTLINQTFDIKGQWNGVGSFATSSITKIWFDN